MKKLLLILFFFAILFACKETRPVGLITDHAMVVSARKEASEIGIQILKKGGNAFDAMIATELALAVAYPYAGNIGGGGFMVYRKNDGSIGALDYREKAPIAAHRNMYLDKDERVIPYKSTRGALAVGVPGTVAGVFEVHKKFGSLPLSEIFEPVISLANKGVVVTQKQADQLKSYQKVFAAVNEDTIPAMNHWKVGDTIVYQALALTLQRILKGGPREFYEGETAKKLISFLQKNSGIMTLEDLAKYEAKWRDPIVFSYDNLKIISMSPPSSGGICLGQMMQALEPYDLKALGHNSTASIQLITEVERRVYADRNHFLGDPDFVLIPTDTLLSKFYIKSRMSDFSFEKATPSNEVAHGNIEIIESEETTHYSIVDSFGNAVAATTTLNGGYGSKLYVPELGFFLNNQMDDFSSKPGFPNSYGLVGAKANEIAPEKRMLSSMTPTIVEKDGKLWMVLGTPGGSTIITSVLQTILNVHEFGMGMQEAVNQPRFHHQWLPDYIRMEPIKFDNKVKKELEALGYQINEKRSKILGKVDAVMVLPNGKLEAGADPRGDDTAIGF